MSKSGRYSYEKALGFLQECLKKIPADRRVRFPSIAQLAKSARLSSSSMLKAVLELQNQGKLSCIKGRGIFAGNRGPSDYRPKPTKFQKALMVLERDIIEGAFAGLETLPSRNELKKRYGVSGPLLVKVLARLERDSVLCSRGNSFYIVAESRQRSFASILLLGKAYPSGKLMLLNDRFTELYNSLERLSISAGVKFRSVGLRMDEHPDTFSALASRDEHIGYVLWTNAVFPGTLRTFLDSVSRTGKPVVLIDEMGDVVPDERHGGDKMIMTIRIAGVSAGKDAARFLVNLGHRIITYISGAHSSQWSQERYQGLQSVFGGLGAGYSVILHAVDSFRPPSSDIFTELDVFADKLFSMLKSLPIPGTSRHPSVVQAFTDAMLTVQDIKNTQTALATEFEAALHRPEITAWVCANDHIATAALDFLRSRNCKVPEKISLVAFDDSWLAFENDLTSYNFDFAKMARLAYSFIINPRNRFFSENWPAIENQGLVIERGSTARI
jgi:DNA-binding LacI/PurR family transcriptional regulator/DNA-binding transcriptional regulator YhcF (GntR family)